MKECDFFESGNSRPPLKIYAILKRERPPKSLLASPQNFRTKPARLSWPAPKDGKK